MNHHFTNDAWGWFVDIDNQYTKNHVRERHHYIQGLVTIEEAAEDEDEEPINVTCCETLKKWMFEPIFTITILFLIIQFV